MKKIYWIFYGIYVLIRLCCGKIKFEILKKRKTKEQIQRYGYEYASGWARRIFERTGSTVNVIGLENVPEETCLFVSNHQEYFDILVMLGYLNKPLGFIAKKELEEIPFVSYWMKQINCVFIDRENQRESVKAIFDGVNNLQNGYSMHVAPEGTRSKGPRMGEFKKGSMKLAIKAGVPVVPVTVNNVYKITEGKSFLNIKPTKVDMIVSQPIDTVKLTKEEQNDLAQTVREIIQENLNKYSSLK